MDNLEYIKNKMCKCSNILTKDKADGMFASFSRNYSFYNNIKNSPSSCVMDNLSTDDFEIFYIIIVNLDYYYRIEISENECYLIECTLKQGYLFPKE